MRAQFVSEGLEFNFKRDIPNDRYKSREGISRSPVENPRKNGYGGGLSPEEEEIIQKHRDSIQALTDEIYSIETQLEDAQGELFNLNNPPITELELDDFYGSIQSKYGQKALDILASGISKEEKKDLLDKIDPNDDAGNIEYDNLVEQYEYYHPDDPDPEEIEKAQKEIKKLETLKQERENTKDKLETKIYNLETY